jgi:hypothetical protein
MSYYLAFPETEIREGETARIEVNLGPLSRDGAKPLRLFIPEECREGMEVYGIIVMNAGHELPLIIRGFKGELFDGDATRQPPYGKLPLVPVDPETAIVLEVRNTTLHPRKFRAEMIVLTPADYE